ncbi:hypothetical protein BKA62DRAFT_462317 [Auriculariales sp. MPI-PUGE-AT-0066]|nr:hypothetical protein BKA62DRAFT_462317 [Auriculariales sp. MPI-PUGE-AT-0066]
MALPVSQGTFDASQSRHVNGMLHALRGEQFRYAQNQRSRREQRSAQVLSSRSLPPLVTPDPPPASFLRLHAHALRTQKRPAAGPAAPSSWVRRDEQRLAQNTCESSEWRAHALALVFEHALASVPPEVVQIDSRSYPIPSLVQLSLDIILSHEPEVAFPILESLPAHLRRQVMLHRAIRDPLPGDYLRALLDSHGAVSGELVLSRSYAPTWLAKAGVLRQNTNANPSTLRDWDEEPDIDNAGGTEEEFDWDMLEGDEDAPLHTLALIHHQLLPAHISALPSSITRLALIAHTTPIPIHRLPSLLPQLVLLDVSYNTWVGAPYVDAAADEDSDPLCAVERVQWPRWRRLRVLGMRECQLPENVQLRVVRAVGHGRLEDVLICL